MIPRILQIFQKAEMMMNLLKDINTSMLFGSQLYFDYIEGLPY